MRWVRQLVSEMSPLPATAYARQGGPPHRTRNGPPSDARPGQGRDDRGDGRVGHGCLPGRRGLNNPAAGRRPRPTVGLPACSSSRRRATAGPAIAELDVHSGPAPDLAIALPAESGARDTRACRVGEEVQNDPIWSWAP